ncbi:DNA repair metallo-beta-lactamase-domain-containing protein [Chaetomium tenue]|uniref:DNA repair metallo-beta-lactamase-domain-containing protein n=1 Tax=Chaetomium tenue TaxID=1854479 RepID=A0ACB7P4D7_9PEZI|nr:DNA repair metallo-beta-lactamase-domain-containing protein [Chaetomium globosum]
MAPSAKSKLSQTRLKTPQKPAVRSTGPLSLPSATKGAKPKTKSKPNQSILSFFKKAPAPDEELFIGGGDNGVVIKGVEDEGQVNEVKEEGDDDLYEASPSRADCGEEGTDEEDVRYNEVKGAVKRRRLSPAPEPGSASEEKESVFRTGSPENVKQTVSATNSKAGPTAAPKRKAGNPFLDESSDEEDDDGDDKENEPVSSAIPRVRSLQPAFDDSNGGDRGTGPAKLTNGTTISRKPPLLRQQTSGADLGGDDNQAGAAQDGIPEDSGDADLFEDEDFTGEELRAMRYMEEQARLEAEEGGEEYEGNDFVDDETMTECCPVCNGSLTGATPDQATAHVNSCLDGNPTPLPKPPGDVIETEGAAVSKRFAKAAIARPGQANPISLGAEAKERPSNSAFTKLMSGHAEDAAWSTAAAAETAARGMPAYKRTCPFYKIMPGFSICVDAFRYGAVEGCEAYFLSHFHSDHYIGLTANWTHGPIYCSKVTGSLVKSQLKTAAKYVVELEFEKTVPVPDTNGVMVTMIPANHCPGSSLFLFEKTTGGRTQRVLHCGDFRACPAHVEHPKLRPETVDAISGRTKQQKIDVCYLDTTYLNPRYSFPPQNDVITACAELCSLLNKSLLANDNGQWETLLRRQRGGASANNKDVSKFFTTTSSTSTKPSSPPPDNAFTALNGRRRNSNRLLVVCGTYSIGKERICVAIAQALQTKIYATPAKIRMCKQLDDPELASLLTSNPTEAQVHMQMLMELRAETLSEYLSAYKARGEFSHIIGFRPSGWNYRPPSTTTTTSSSSSSAPITANLPPTSLPTLHLLHHPSWRPRFAVRDLVPQRGATAEALCFGAPYSEHSSFRELALFVLALRIERVVPTVGVGISAET